MVSPLRVANTFVEKHGEEGDLSHMKLQKLVFFTDGWGRAFGDKIISERPQVWRYGPVYRSLYGALSPYGSRDITTPLKPPSFVLAAPGLVLDPDQNPKELALTDWVWERYGGFNAGELSTMTHEKGTPWQIMAERYEYEVPPSLEIDDDVLDSYFKGLARAEGLIQPDAGAAANPA